MKYFSYILLAAFAMFLLAACDDESASDFHEEIVVDGFMWVGQRMQISLTKVVPIGQAYYADSVQVTDADVTITVDGQTMALTEAHSGVPGTYAAHDSVQVVTTGKRYDLMIALDGDTLRAHSTAVAPLTLTQAALVDLGEEVTDPNPDTLEYGGDQLRLSWTTDPVNFGYAVIVEALDDAKYGESCDFGNDNGPGSYLFIWSTRFVSGIDLPWITLCYTGETRVRVFSCDTAWWNFVSTIFVGETRNDPVSNIQGGKGVFCAIGCDTFDIMVTDTLED